MDNNGAFRTAQIRAHMRSNLRLDHALVETCASALHRIPRDVAFLVHLHKDAVGTQLVLRLSQGLVTPALEGQQGKRYDCNMQELRWNPPASAPLHPAVPNQGGSTRTT